MRSTDPKHTLHRDEELYNLTYPRHGRCEVEESRARITVLDGRRHQYLFKRSPIVKVQKGGFGDMISIDLPDIFLVSDKLRGLFEEAQVSGVEYKQATVVPAFPHPTKQIIYWQLVVTGWGGLVPQSLSDWTLECLERFYQTDEGVRERTVECYRVYAGLNNSLPLFNKDQWDGSDFFYVWPLMGNLFVSRKVANVLTASRVKHFSLVQLAEFRLPEIGGIVCSSRVQPLACYYPLERARQIGEPLGIYSW